MGAEIDFTEIKAHRSVVSDNILDLNIRISNSNTLGYPLGTLWKITYDLSNGRQQEHYYANNFNFLYPSIPDDIE